MEYLRKRKMNGVFVLLGFLMLIFFCGARNNSPSWAAEKPYPHKPITLVVPSGPGGVMDLGSRVIADKIETFLGERLIPICKPGGGSSLGAEFVAKAKPDGYTILAGSSTPLVIVPIVKKVDYKLDDFALVGMYGTTPIRLAVKPDARWKTLQDFIGEAKNAPGKLMVSSFGKLTIVDFGIELLSKQAKIKLTHVPYKSSPEAVTAVLGDHADAAMVSGTGGLAEAGSIRLLAVASEQRMEGFPNVPTFREIGYSIELSVWQSLCFPKGTPKEAVNRLYIAQKKAFESYQKEIKEGLKRVEIDAIFLEPEESMRRFKKEYELVFQIATELGVVAK